MFKTTSCLQYRISGSCGVEKLNHTTEDHPDVLAGKMTHSLCLVWHIHRKPEGSAESHREVRIHQTERSLCYMSHEDWWEYFQAEAEDIKEGFLSDHLYWSVFVSQSYRFKPLSHFKLAKLSHWNGAGFVQLENFDRAQTFSGSGRCGFCFWPDQDLNFCRMCSEPKPDLTQILTISSRCLLLYKNQRLFHSLCWGKNSLLMCCVEVL